MQETSLPMDKDLFKKVFDMAKTGTLQSIGFTVPGNELQVLINDHLPNSPEEEQLAFEMENWLSDTEMLYVKSFHPFIQNEQLFIRAESAYDVLSYGESLDLDYIQDKISPLVGAHLDEDPDHTQIMMSMNFNYDGTVTLSRYSLVYDGEEETDLSDDNEIKKQIMEEILAQAAPSQNQFTNSSIVLTIEDNYLCDFQIKWEDLIKISIIV